MKILWIVHDVLEPFFPFVDGKPSKGGSWIDPLFFSLVNVKNIKMGIISPVINGTYQHKEINGVSYYAVPIAKGDNTSFMSEKISKNYLAAIEDFDPDIIHVHGTENNFGQLREYVDKKIPIACSIQGIIYAYLPYLKSSTANINLSRFKSIKNILGRGGVELFQRIWSKYISIEKNIIKINQYFIGRTLWDKAQILEVNPSANYFNGEELLRNVFYNKKWDINTCNKYQIFVSSAAYPIKGFHTILKAVSLLKIKYPKIKLVCPLASLNMSSSKLWDILFVDDYRRYIKSKVFEYELSNNIQFLDRISAEDMAFYYKESRVFVLPSFVENSPNSLGEAMMVGTPTIVTPVGGVMSIVSNEVNTLMFPAGDHASLAYQIDKIFSDDKLAQNLSSSAKEIACKRHNIEVTTKQYIDIYKDIIELHLHKYSGQQ